MSFLGNDILKTLALATFIAPLFVPLFFALVSRVRKAAPAATTETSGQH
jgi:hypothetical protein